MATQQQPGGFGLAVQEAYPLLLSMSQGLRSGNGIFSQAGSGLSAMMAMDDREREERERAAAEAARRAELGMVTDLFGGWAGGQGGNSGVVSSQGGNGQRNAAMAAYGGPTKQAADALNLDFSAYEQRYGLPQGYLSRTAQIESSMNPRAQNPNSSAGGLFQFIDSTAQQYGLADRMDPVAATDAAARLASDNAAILRRALGREPTAGELYLAHQQGAGGAAKMLSNPNARAVDVVGAEAVRLNSGDANMTAGQFASKWTGKFGGGQAPVMSTQGQAQSGQQRSRVDPARLAQIVMSPNLPASVKNMALNRAFPSSEPVNWQQFKGSDGGIYAFNPRTRETQQIMGPGAPEQTATQQNLAWRAEQAGMRPGTPEYQQFMRTGGAAQSSAKVEQIGRLESIGIPRDVAIKIADGVYTTSRDPITGETQVIDIASGQSVYRAQPDTQQQTQQPGAEQTPAPQQPQDNGLTFGDNVPSGGEAAFGLQGIATNIGNTVSDFVGAGEMFPQTAEQTRFFKNLEEDLLVSLSQAYGRQPAQALMERLRSLVPQAGSVEGAQRARGELEQLRGRFENDLASAQSRLGTRLSPQDRSEINSQITGLEATVRRIREAEQRLGGGSGGNAGTTSSGIQWSVE